MESYEAAPVFIDVEHAPDRYLLTQDICQGLVTERVKGETTNHTTSTVYQEGESIHPTTESEIQQTIHNDIPTTSRSEVSETRQPRKSTDYTDEPKDLGPVARRIRCPECQRYTAETEEMLRHIKKVHKGENPFQCYMCDYSTYNKSLFEEHVRIHQGIKPFKCPQCDYKSASKKNLKKHQLIHRPNNPLKCKQCDFIARHPKALKRHADIHTGTNWFKFDTCKFQFQDLAAFKKHERTHKLKCKECEFKSCSRPFLKRHMVKEHGFVDDSVKRETFSCQICKWTSSTMAKILLHLIHHPKQEVDESVIDVSILRKHGIMT